MKRSDATRKLAVAVLSGERANQEALIRAGVEAWAHAVRALRALDPPRARGMEESAYQRTLVKLPKIRLALHSGGRIWIAARGGIKVEGRARNGLRSGRKLSTMPQNLNHTAEDLWGWTAKGDDLLRLLLALDRARLACWRRAEELTRW